MKRFLVPLTPCDLPWKAVAKKLKRFQQRKKKQSEIVVNSMLLKPNPNRIRAENNKVKIEQKVSFRSTRLETKPSERSILRSLNVEMLLEKMDTNCSVHVTCTKEHKGHLWDLRFRLAQTSSEPVRTEAKTAAGLQSVAT